MSTPAPGSPGPEKPNQTRESMKDSAVPSAPESRHERFVERYGTNEVHELEALEPSVLQSVVEDAIWSVIDTELFQLELAQEKKDVASLAALRKTFHEALNSMKWEETL